MPDLDTDLVYGGRGMGLLVRSNSDRHHLLVPSIA